MERGTVLGARAVVTLAEHDGFELPDVIRRERAATGEPHFDRVAGRHVLTVEAGGQGRGVVGHHKVAGPQEINERRSREMSDLTERVDHQQIRMCWPMKRKVCRDRRPGSATNGNRTRGARRGRCPAGLRQLRRPAQPRQSPAA